MPRTASPARRTSPRRSCPGTRAGHPRASPCTPRSRPRTCPEPRSRGRARSPRETPRPPIPRPARPRTPRARGSDARTPRDSTRTRAARRVESRTRTTSCLRVRLCAIRAGDDARRGEKRGAARRPGVCPSSDANSSAKSPTERTRPIRRVRDSSRHVYKRTHAIREVENAFRRSPRASPRTCWSDPEWPWA